MNEQLRGDIGSSKDRRTKYKTPEHDLTPLPPVDIGMVSASEFHWNMHQKEVTVFSLSINELNHMITAKDINKRRKAVEQEDVLDEELVL